MKIIKVVENAQKQISTRTADGLEHIMGKLAEMKHRVGLTEPKTYSSPIRRVWNNAIGDFVEN